MISPFLRTRRRRSSIGWRCSSDLVMLALLLVACDGSSGTTTRDGSPPMKKTSIALPSDLLQSGVLTIGSDTTYPPQEYIDPVTKKAVGFDIDLITMMAARMRSEER